MKRALVLLVVSTLACSSSGSDKQASVTTLSYKTDARPVPEAASPLNAVARAVEHAVSTVRGRLVRVDREGRQYPAAGVAVRLNHPKYGPSSVSYSGADGMYYLVNIPPGMYTLEVWLSPQSMLPFQIQVFERQFTDIAPIRIP